MFLAGPQLAGAATHARCVPRFVALGRAEKGEELESAKADFTKGLAVRFLCKLHVQAADAAQHSLAHALALTLWPACQQQHASPIKLVARLDRLACRNVQAARLHMMCSCTQVLDRYLKQNAKGNGPWLLQDYSIAEVHTSCP